MADESRPDAASFRLLQQQLVDAHERLDRQVEQLMRLNRLSDQLVDVGPGANIAATFAEAIVDILDVGVAAVWLLRSNEPVPSCFHFFGARVGPSHWSSAGLELAAALGSMRGATRVDFLVGDLLPEGLVDPVACCALGRDGAASAVVLAASTPATAGMSRPHGDEFAEMLALIAEKLAVHLEGSAGRRIIQEQFEALQQSEDRLERVLQGTNDGWWDWDMVSDQCFVSSRWSEMLGGRAVAEMRDGFWTDLMHPVDRPAFEWALQRARLGLAQSMELELRLRSGDDDYLPVLVRATMTYDAAGTPTRFAGSIFDLSERKRHEAAVRRLAFYDPLTDLPNRRFLFDRLEQDLAAAQRSQQMLAVVMIDLDRFKAINDSHGHAAGDQLLRLVSRRLRENVRSGDTVARLSGDEFVLVLKDLGDTPTLATERALKIAWATLGELNQPFTLDVGPTHHSASIGVAVQAGEDTSVALLLQQADVALYEAKASGRNTVRVFAPEMQARVDARADLEARLRQALPNRELSVEYQAQVDASGVLVGAEALLRWRPKGSPAVPPCDFIPIAEETGIIHELGGWVLETVCRQMVEWRDFVPPGFRVAVNLSAPEFLHPDFPERVLATLDRTGARGDEIRLEITEATVVTELEFAAERVLQLRAAGIAFSLDDFGTGYSSLTYLRQLPVDEVKIDRSYVRSFTMSRHDAAIVRAIIALCSSLDLRVVAEGVETVDELDMLVAEGCEFFQGYLFSRPQPPPRDPVSLVSLPVASEA